MRGYEPFYMMMRSRKGSLKATGRKERVHGHVRDRERTQAILCPTNQRPKTRVERTRLTLRVTVGTYEATCCFIPVSERIIRT